jgi:unsaturated chondroitin disaccharide hydrolase
MVRKSNLRNPAGVAILSLVSVFITCGNGPGLQEDSFDMSHALKEEALSYIGESLRRTVEFSGERFPVATEEGVWELNDGGWTGGYFAGMLWMMYADTSDQYWRQQAEKYTWLLESYKNNADMSDVGILFWPSFDLGFSLIGDPKMREVGLEGARSMMRRFIPEGGYVQNWGRLAQEDRMGFVIIDCLINLDHLYWATQQTGDQSFAEAATSHAELTRVSHVRTDFSSFQVVEFDPSSGSMLRGFTKQGYVDQSTWSRGQAWGIYGFTRVFVQSREDRFLETACKMADWFIERLPPDYVPYWDFSAPEIPNEPRDTSAASMVASGLLELAQYVEDDTQATYYRRTADKILASLTRKYLTRDLSGHGNGVLTGGTYFFEIGRSVNQSNIWGDFYYLEALLRWSENKLPK